MTDKTKVTVNAKELASVIDDDRAHQMYARKGGRWIAIIELKHAERHEKVDGEKRVNLVIDEFELVDDGVLDGRAADHVRDIKRALHRNRKLSEDGPQLPLQGDGDEPTVEGVVAARASVLDDDEDGPKVWDGDTLPDDQADDEGDEPDPATPDDPAFDPHAYVATSRDEYFLCGYHGCGQEADAAVHTTADDRDLQDATT